MFDALKKAQALEALGKKAGDIFHIFTTVDADHNGIADFKENMEDLKALPALLKKLESTVEADVAEGHKEMEAILLRIAGRLGTDVEQVQKLCAAQIADIEKHIATLQK